MCKYTNTLSSNIATCCDSHQDLVRLHTITYTEKCTTYPLYYAYISYNFLHTQPEDGSRGAETCDWTFKKRDVFDGHLLEFLHMTFNTKTYPKLSYSNVTQAYVNLAKRAVEVSTSAHVQINPNNDFVSDKETLTNYTTVSALESRSVFQFADCRTFRWHIVHVIERSDEVLPGIL